jgi:hypothetical protein
LGREGRRDDEGIEIGNREGVVEMGRGNQEREGGNREREK